MDKLKIGIQCSSYGQRCGISTYAERLNNYLNKIEGVESQIFVSRLRDKVDVISVQYEPGLIRGGDLNNLIQKYPQPIIVTAHHMGELNKFFPLLDGIVLHNESQIEEKDKPWSYKVIPHPALVFEKKDKKKLREKYGLPKDKKIIGTMGFIVGTGKELPSIIKFFLKNLKDDEFLYFATSFWKGGDFGHEEQIKAEVKRYGKEGQFRIDTDFVDEEELNEKMQLCDLLFAWNNMDNPKSNSGIAMDMIGSRTKVIVKDSTHYKFAAGLKGVVTGRSDPGQFAEDVFKLLREGDLKDVPDPIQYSWENLTKMYLDYFKEVAGL